jgi:hypothetical protein
MTKAIAVLNLFIWVFATSTQAQTDEEKIRAVVNSAYIEGIQNRGSSEQIRRGFHHTFEMLRFVDNEVKPYPIEDWITAIEKAKADNTPAQPRAEGKFITIDVTGTAAVVKLEVYREGKKTFTDYLSLYKFADGWRIVSKIYNRH